MKRTLILSLLLLGSLFFCAGAEAANVTVTTLQWLKDALHDDTSKDIEIGANLMLDQSLVISKDHTLSVGSGFKLTPAANQTFFTVGTATESPTVTFENMAFENSTGGGIDVQSGTAAFNNGSFTNNTTPGDGGAVKIAGNGKATFNGTNFTGNTATGDGGAVHAATGAAVELNTVTFTNNTAKNGGAAALQLGGKATLSNAVTFSGNRATDKGGALYILKGEDVTLSPGTVFRNNQTDKDGGAAYVDTGVLSLPDGISLTANDAKENGGAVALGGAGTVRLGRNTITHNHAKNGGAVHAPAGSTLEFTQDLSLSNNSADVGGGAIWADALTLNPETHKLTFSINNATQKGGAVYVTNSVTINGNVTFSDNNSDGSGGAVHSDGSVTLEAGLFKKNTAGTNGGAVYAEKDITVTGTESAALTFEEHSAGQSGGALYAKGELKVENTVFRTNKAGSDSGGATFSGGKTKLKNCLLKKNFAGKHGGASIGGALEAVQTSFIDNTAVQTGGAVYLTGEGKSSFEGCAFVKNQANTHGGSLFLTGDKHELILRTCVFDGNYAAGGQGGALHLAGTHLTLFRCTFTGNSAAPGTTASGGAAHIETSVFRIANCTFHSNEAGQGKGGAVHIASSGGSGTSGKSALLYCTFAANKAGGGQGGGLWTACPELSLMGVLSVGNTASFGADIFSGGGKIKSRSYNILSGYGEQGSSGPADKVDWKAAAFVDLDGDGRNDSQSASNTFALFFGDGTKPAWNDSLPTEKAGSPLSAPDQKELLTLALRATTASSPNPALDAIPQNMARNRFNTYFSGLPHTDERGVNREDSSVGNCDIGAYERGTGVVPPDPSGNGALAYIKISGIPNTHTAVGQTTSLVAVAYDQNGKTIQNEPVKWKSSNPAVAHIDDFGNLYARSLGKTVISVTTVRQSVSGKPATDSATLEVRDDMSYTNVHPEIWKMLGEFNETLSTQGAGLTFADSDPAKVRASTFQSTFRKAWGTSATQVTELKSGTPIRFKTGKLPSAQGWSASKPAIDISLSGRGKGEMLPLKYRWSLSWDELSALMGRKVTKVNARELSSVLKLAFTSANGESYDVVGGDGVAVAEAESKGALRMASGNNGLTLELTAFVANVASEASSRSGSVHATTASGTGPQLIDGLLVVPDGTADGTIAGALGLLQKPASHGGSDKGNSGGGGGCDAGTAGAVWLLLVMPVLLRRKP